MLLCIVGFRGVITLHNPLNHAAEFTWTPILGDRGTAFSIRPAEGMLHYYSDLRGGAEEQLSLLDQLKVCYIYIPILMGKGEQLYQFYQIVVCKFIRINQTIF